MKNASPRLVGDLLVSAIPQLEDRLLVERLRRDWAALIGPDAARRCRPQALVKGCLQIVVDNGPWLAELTLLGPELTARLAGRHPVIRSLRFTLGAPPAEDRPPAARPAPRNADLTEDDRRAIDAAAAAISDPALAATARRLLARGWTPAARGIE